MDSVLLLNHTPDPRIQKRVGILREAGSVHLLCVRRKDSDFWDINDVQYDSVRAFNAVLPSSGRPLRRVIAMREFAAGVLHDLKKMEPEVIYTENLDCLAVAWIHLRRAKKRPLVCYEVADIREILLCEQPSLSKRMKSALVKWVEKRIIGIVDVLIVTSVPFYTEYYVNLLPNCKVVYAPNAPSSVPFQAYKVKNSGAFRVGFIGAVRYVHQMELLVEAAKCAQVEVLIAGAGLTPSIENDFEAFCNAYDNVELTGKYDYETEISSLYSQIDCVYAVYDADNPNVRIALPNKLYEAVYCELPIIVAKGTYLAQLVCDWGIGFAVSHNSPEDLVRVLTAMRQDPGILIPMRESCKALKRQKSWDGWRKELKGSLACKTGCSNETECA